MPYKSKYSALFNTRYKRDDNVKWYRRNRPTINSKLRRAIRDALPFEFTNDKQADRVLWAIFDHIFDTLLTEGVVKLPKIGKLRLYTRAPVSLYNFKARKRELLPPKVRIKFEPTDAMRLVALREDPNGDSGRG